MLTGLHIDIETRSAIDLKETNAYVYFDNPTTDIWCVAYSFGKGEPELWFPGQPMPESIIEHVSKGGLIYAWNAAFERLAWWKLLTPRYKWLRPCLEQFRCVMAQAYALALPGGLENAALALGVTEVKDQIGYRLMLRMSRPRLPRKSEDPSRLYWWDDPADIARLAEYCQQDVKTEIAAFERLLPLSNDPLGNGEQQVWFLDQRINDRGVYVDIGLCEAAFKVIQQTQVKLDHEMSQITNGEVHGVSNVADLIGFVNKNGFDAKSIAKDQLLELLVRDDLPLTVRRALELRQEGAKASTAKIKAMLVRRQADGRMRGLLQYHGASTGRWAARGAQLQNLPRPSMKPKQIAKAIEDLEIGNAETIEIIHGRPLSVVSDCIRSMIAASPGYIIRAVDFSAIEARVIAWLAGEQHKLEVFRAYDAKQGPDPYRVAAAAIYGVPVTEVTDTQRQVGKVAELALGYQGGPGAFSKMAKGYGLDIGAVYDTVWSAATQPNRYKALEGWDRRGRTSGMAKLKWITAELVKLAWRDTNPATVDFWQALEDAAFEAVKSPGRIVSAGHHIRYRKVGSWLFCRLPSGRAIAYAYPYAEWIETPWESHKFTITYKGVDSFTRKWEKQVFYGGLAADNVAQATSRDVMRDAMLRVTDAGYDIVLTVHDELVSENQEEFGSLDEFCRITAQNPTWAEDLPISVEGWEGKRYRK